MRLFVALDIDDSIRERISRFMDGVREFAPDARWVRPESLHITLKFIGEKPSEMVSQIEQAFSAIAAPAVKLTFRGVGFFPSPKSARVFWIGIEAGSELAALAKSVDDAAASLGFPRETHGFSPHLTLARGGSGSGAPHRQQADARNRGFRRLQEKLAALPAPEFGTMSAHEFFLYLSKLGRGGSKYTKLHSFQLSQGGWQVKPY